MIIGYVAMILVIIGLDQWSKLWITNHLHLGEQIWQKNPLFSLTHVRNEGAAWNILEGQKWFFIVITIVIVIVGSFYLYKSYKEHSSYWLTIGISFVLGGALGNFIDRLHLGYVVDMIQLNFINFPIFNLADSALTIGVICLLIHAFLDEKKQ